MFYLRNNAIWGYRNTVLSFIFSCVSTLHCISVSKKIDPAKNIVMTTYSLACAYLLLFSVTLLFKKVRLWVGLPTSLQVIILLNLTLKKHFVRIYLCWWRICFTRRPSLSGDPGGLKDTNVLVGQAQQVFFFYFNVIDTHTF